MRAIALASDRAARDEQAAKNSAGQVRGQIKPSLAAVRRGAAAAIITQYKGERGA